MSVRKTLVAALAASCYRTRQQQVALMAPTKYSLAEQHANTFRQWLEPPGISVGWVAGNRKARHGWRRKKPLPPVMWRWLSAHTPFFRNISVFHALALVIIDEQHRFGVHRAAGVMGKGEQQGFHPHQLIMTATPIPCAPLP
ncbi:DEAD/DEAH box helicase [Shigella flexneri]